MGQGRLIRQLGRRTIELPNATEYARATGALGPDEAVEVTIRRVSALEVTKGVGTPPAMLRAARLRREGESDAEWTERWRDIVADDPELGLESVRYTAELQRVVIAAGMVDPPASLEPTDDPDTITPEDLGPDAAIVYEAIVELSGLPYRLREGADRSSAFPEGRHAGDVGAHGGEVRNDPEPPAGQ